MRWLPDQRIDDYYGRRDDKIVPNFIYGFVLGAALVGLIWALL